MNVPIIISWLDWFAPFEYCKKYCKLMNIRMIHFPMFIILKEIDNNDNDGEDELIMILTGMIGGMV